MKLKTLMAGMLLAAACVTPSPASAAANYMTGRINNVTFAHDWVMVALNTGLPDNCVGTSYGWMKISPANKPMIAFVTGLWLRGDNAQVDITVYTSGIADGYCSIAQIDPVG